MAMLHEALTYARHGIPVFPCVPGEKRPLTEHGFEDATTDPDQLHDWWGRWPSANIAMPTGAPRWDVLDVDVKPSGSGYDHLRELREAGLTQGWSHAVHTPSGGLHLYFAGTTQGNSSLPNHHIDFRSAGGYVLVPPSSVTVLPGRQRAYNTIRLNPADTVRPVSWDAIRNHLNPTATPAEAAPAAPPAGHAPAEVRMPYLARHVATAAEGNRNAALYWAANRALDNGAVDLNPLIDAALQAGLPHREAMRTVESAQRRRRTPRPPRGQEQVASASPPTHAMSH